MNVAGRYEVAAEIIEQTFGGLGDRVRRGDLTQKELYSLLPNENERDKAKYWRLIRTADIRWYIYRKYHAALSDRNSYRIGNGREQPFPADMLRDLAIIMYHTHPMGIADTGGEVHAVNALGVTLCGKPVTRTWFERETTNPEEVTCLNCQKKIPTLEWV